MYRSTLISKWRVLFIFIIIFTIYSFFLFSANKSVLDRSVAPYYNNLIYSLINFKLNLINLNSIFDISIYNSKNYMYWGPAPILFIFPFYIINNGILTSDIMYTFFFGCLNIFLFYICSKQFCKYFQLKQDNENLLLITLAFAFSSPNFYLSMIGRVWHTYQILATTYLLLFFYYYFKSLNNKINFKYLIFSLIFCCLAWLSRYTLIFHMLFFIYPVFEMYKKKSKDIFKNITILSAITLAFIAILFAYNYFRFGNVFETGFKYQVHDARFDEVFKSQKFFSFDYFFYNIFYYFLNSLELNIKSPFTFINAEGNSVFVVYPFLLLLFFFFQKKFFIKLDLLKIIIGLVIAINTFVLMLFVGTGWVQFGNRYFFDVIPLLFFLISFVIAEVPVSIASLLLIYGTIINILGSLTFYRFF